jgi:hypothetical protein
MQKLLVIFFILFSSLCLNVSFAQVAKDSTTKKNEKSIIDTIGVKTFNPHKATIRSAILPGWGQIYNKKYWKLPLVYGALGATAAVFFYNVKTYKSLKQAYIYKSDTIAGNDILIDPQFKNLSATSLKTYRNAVRQNVDYSVLFFLLFWGLNVVDATVDAQLKAFDVNDNISLKLNPGYSPTANTTGLSLVFDIHSKSNKGAK